MAMQFKINKNTDIEALSKDMTNQIMDALETGLRNSITLEGDQEKDIVVDIFVNIRTNDLKNQ